MENICPNRVDGNCQIMYAVSQRFGGKTPVVCSEQALDRCSKTGCPYGVNVISVSLAINAVIDNGGDEIGILTEATPILRAGRVCLKRGTGTILMRWLWWTKIWSRPQCLCDYRAALMNARGPQWCRDNVKTVVGWMREEAKARHLPFSELVMSKVILKAADYSEKAGQPV